jgi:hypothetical protein
MFAMNDVHIYVTLFIYNEINIKGWDLARERARKG